MRKLTVQQKFLEHERLRLEAHKLVDSLTREQLKKFLAYKIFGAIRQGTVNQNETKEQL